ncbi:MAG TPA: VOC family protein [Terracidiphilus sp.]|jgi:PhnB protein|nr:VOC family protein [Terracidiphilus sp.]
MTGLTGRPQQFSALTPLLTVQAGGSAIDFYKNAFGAVEQYRMVSDSGAVTALLRVGDSDFWVVDEAPEHLNLSPASLGGTTVRMVLVVSNPDAVFERAIEAGAKALWPMVDQPYGWRIGRLADPFGHHWEIGKPQPNAA